METTWQMDSDVLDFEQGYFELEHVSPFVRAFFVGARNEHEGWMDAISIAPPARQKSLDEHCRDLAAKLVNKHPGISIYRGIFGGIPHVSGVRLSVADVLGHLYVLGSIEAILERYGKDVSEEQIKEAVAYAQDFLEEAFHA